MTLTWQPPHNPHMATPSEPLHGDPLMILTWKPPHDPHMGTPLLPLTW